MIATGEGGVSAQSSASYGSATTAGVNVSVGGLTAGAFGEEVQNDRGDATKKKQMQCQLHGMLTTHLDQFQLVTKLVV